MNAPATLPWFKFHWQIFLTGTSLFSTEEVGAYLKLLIYQWDKGFVPSEEKKISAIAGVKFSKLSDVLSKFDKGEDGNYRNARLEKERQSTEKYFVRQSENASKGGRPPKPTGNPRDSHGKPTGSPEITHGKPIEEEDKEERKKNVVDGTTSLWFPMFRRAAGPHINDEMLTHEIGLFLNKYPNAHPNRSGALVNTWVGRIGMDIPEQPAVKKMVY